MLSHAKRQHRGTASLSNNNSLAFSYITTIITIKREVEEIWQLQK